MSIYCLVDTHADSMQYETFKNDCGSDCIFSSYSSSHRGVAILFNDRLEYHVPEIEKDDIGNLLIV